MVVVTLQLLQSLVLLDEFVVLTCVLNQGVEKVVLLNDGEGRKDITTVVAVMNQEGEEQDHHLVIVVEGGVHSQEGRHVAGGVQIRANDGLETKAWLLIEGNEHLQRPIHQLESWTKMHMTYMTLTRGEEADDLMNDIGLVQGMNARRNGRN